MSNPLLTRVGSSCCQMTKLRCRTASVSDCAALANWNHQLIRDEGHRTPMTFWSDETRLTVDVLVGNEVAISFWRALGYEDYALTLEITRPGV